MKLKHRLQWLLAGCALAAGIGASLSAFADDPPHPPFCCNCDNDDAQCLRICDPRYCI